MKIILSLFTAFLLLLSAEGFTMDKITNPKVKWKFKTEGPIRAAASLSGDRVFIASTDGHLYALNKESGTMLWKFETKGSITATPCVAGNLVIIPSRDNKIYAIDMQSGKEVWSFQMNPRLEGYMEWEYFMSAPVVSGEKVFIGSADGNLYALLITDGKLQWKYKTPDRIRSTPLVANNRVYQACNDGMIYVIKEDTGEIDWALRTKGASFDKSNGFDRTNIFSRLWIKNNLLIFGSRDGNVYAANAKTGDIKWTFTYGMTWAMSTAVDDEAVYAGYSTNNTFCAIDLKTGAERWKYICGSVVYTTAALLDDQVVFGSADGNLYCMNKQSGAKIWQYSVGNEIHASPIYDPSGKMILVGSDDGFLYALEESTKVYAAVYNPLPKNAGTSYPLIDVRIVPYLKDKDFKLLDSAKLFQFLTDRIKDKAPSCIVFAYDVIPKNMVGDAPEKGMIRQYLETGGKIVWFGGVPNIFYFDGKGKFIGPRDLTIATRMLDVEFSTPEESGNYYSQTTPEGKSWGLPPWLTTTYSVVSPKNGVVPLAYDEMGRVSGWLKRFNSRPYSGFVSLRTWGWEVPMREEDFNMLYDIAMYGLK